MHPGVLDSAGSLQRAPQAADDDAAGAVVGRRLDLIVDIQHQFRHVVVPVEMRHRFGRKPAAAGDIHQRGSRRRKLVDVVQHRLKQLCSRNDPLGEALGEMDFETAAKLSGARFVVLKKGLARLERA